ncbi:retropepsin-like aspartic protease [Mucilaginibacter terrae]|uniref:Aspartyl protease n=1 Tax=Mucilaginibacter terrae TaxID=1955052 RepID=A0ABU3GRS1_9SPHI|nr:retropepsin-like aspartic protease [Mucilaginibacter terrae]MDT3402462.1 putative aspartyl protease [Mucilaginibacter terrae]
MKVNIPLQVIDMQGDGYHLLVNVKIGRKKYNVVLDTGASKTVFDHELLAKANKSIVMEATHRLSAGLGTLSMESFTAVVPVFNIGRLELPDFEVAVLDLSTINQAYAQLNHPEVLGVLGGDILMQYKAVIDYGKKRLKLEV